MRGRGRVPDPRGAFQAVLLELVRGVLNPFRGLRLRQRAVDAGRRLRAVASEERGLIQEKDAAAVLEDGVRGGQAREAAADDDDLFAHRARFTGASSTKAAAARERSARQLLTVKKVKVSPKAPGPVLQRSVRKIVREQTVRRRSVHGSKQPASRVSNAASGGRGPAREKKSHERTAPRRTPRERASATMAAVMPALPWCTNCQEEVEAETNESNGFTCVRARARVARASRCISFRPPRARMNSRARPPILTVPPPSLSQLLHAMW